MADQLDICARLCLLTRIAWEDGIPQPLSRPMMRRLLESGALRGMQIDDRPVEESALLARARLLLARFKRALACLEAYEAQGYSVILPEDAAWPRRLYALGSGMPQFLFLRGNPAILGKKGVAVAGSREIAAHTASLARHVGQRLAGEGLAMVCGGARGVDAAAQQGLLEIGGGLVLVPAQPVGRLLGESARSGGSRNVLRGALDEGRLLIACDALPDDPFSPQRAIMRNHMIYALAEAAIVVASRCGAGGSWHGAMDCLRGGYTPVFAADGASMDMEGNKELIRAGAKGIDLLAPLGAQMFAVRQTCLPI